MARLAALALLAACEASPVYVRLVPGDEELLADAADLLELDLRMVAPDGEVLGSITVGTFQIYGAPKGLALVRTGPRRAAASDPLAVYVAHEIGHCLGLEHVEDVHNLMHSCASPGATINDEQRRILAIESSALLSYRPVWSRW